MNSKMKEIILDPIFQGQSCDCPRTRYLFLTCCNSTDEGCHRNGPFRHDRHWPVKFRCLNDEKLDS
jgi:hypothetical protein